MWGFFANFCGNQIYVTVLLKNVGSICPLRHVEALIQSNAEKCNADSLICALSGWLEIKWSWNVTETFPDLSHCRQFKPPLRTIQACVCWIHNTADYYFLKRGSTAGRTFTPLSELTAPGCTNHIYVAVSSSLSHQFLFTAVKTV